MKRVKLLAIDCQPVMLEGLHTVLSSAGYDVSTAVNEEEALLMAVNNRDIALLVVASTLLDLDETLSIIRKFRTNIPDIRVVMYLSKEEVCHFLFVDDSIVEGIVVKNENINQLIFAVSRVCQGKIYRSPDFKEHLDSIRKLNADMSKTDMEILHLICRGKSTSEISNIIHLTEKSIEYHRSNILKKLGCRNMAEAIHKAIRSGIVR